MNLSIPFTALTLIYAYSSQALCASEGKNLAFDRNKGNCLACHVIEDGTEPGNIGPALSNLPLRFRDKHQLRQQIWDATVFNPDTSMPPFGRNKILTEVEIDRIVDYLWSIE
ncbi:MAG: sulfur oxidation c-type cytochrome SoxX [Gammaproteobacteria bacterium]